TKPEIILAIMSFETIQSFSPSKENKKTGATGLIQFLPSTARSMLVKTLLDPKISIQAKRQMIDKFPLDQATKDSLNKLISAPANSAAEKARVKSRLDLFSDAKKGLTAKLKELNAKEIKAKKGSPQDLPNIQQEKAKVLSDLKEVSAEVVRMGAELKKIAAEAKSIPKQVEALITSSNAKKIFANMTAVDQLDYVKQYFAPYKGKLNTPEDAYLAVLYPVAVGYGNDPNHIVFSAGSAAYRDNSHLDKKGDGDGNVTVKEATKAIRDFLAQAAK
ncbi:MAG: hypothetical protein AB1489_41225, partial [Acidobacteriota bacterium]